MDSSHVVPETSLQTGEQFIQECITRARKLLDSDPSGSLQIADQAVCAADGLTIYPEALAVRAQANNASGHLAEALTDFTEALEQAQLSRNARLEGRCWLGIANMQFTKGNLGTTLEYIHRAGLIFREIDDERGLVLCLQTQGAVLGELGSFADAAACFLEALSLSRRSGNRVLEGHTLNNIGLIKMECGELEEAILYYEQSIAIYKEIEGDRLLAMSLTNLATIYRKLNRLPEALRAAQEAIAIVQDYGSDTTVQVLTTLGRIQTDQSDFVSAEVVLLRALRLAENIGAELCLAELRLDLGILYTRLSDFHQAQQSFEAGLTYAAAKKRQSIISRIYRELAAMYAASNDYRLAFEAQCKFTEIEGELQKQRAQNLLIAQMSRLEAERARQDAEIQRQKIAELAVTNQRNEELLGQLQQHADQLTAEALTDPLTGLHNRRYLQKFVLEKIVRTANCSVAIADLDNFKQINDHFGHPIGDVVLKAAARLLQGAVRHSDVVCRFGGEEFIVVFPDMLRTEAMPICERMRLAIVEHDWTAIDPALHVTVSIGLADNGEASSVSVASTVSRQWNTQDAFADHLFTLADRQLYLAKKRGKNRVV